jgi:signal transduction histidine kinase/DNA-binding NarL/FixJ family response regulator
LEFDPQGALLGGFGTVQDISERKRAEERTRLLSDVTAQLLASDQPQRIVEVLCRRVMDHLGCHAFFNFLLDEQAGRLHLNACAGIPDETARAIEWLDFGVAVCGCVARDGCRIVAEHVQTTSDPRADLVRSLGIQAYACHPLLNQGRTIGTLSFGSRSKPAFTDEELDLMKAVADHVAIAMQRIRLLESLERHARAAEMANQAKTQFLANMSHELRTPMNAILGMIDVALPKATDPVVQDCLQTAKGSADLLLTLLNDLLDSAKIESGKLELESAPFSLRRMLDQVTRVLSVRASEKGLCFCCRIPNETPDAVMGDRMRLQQVLLNLAGNAIKFTECGEVEIRLRAVSRDGEASLEFAVRDTGIGIPPFGLERLFQPFAQVDASMARRFGGTGLGLSISKSLVELMGGGIWVESEMGKGSTFYFTVRLPLATELPPDIEAPVAHPTAARGQLRVLLVEDNPANQKLATYILQDRGHIVEIAGDGLEALCLAEQNRYDVILMDVQMPGMSGLEATAAIRKREAEKGSGFRIQDSEGDGGCPNPDPRTLNPEPSRVPIIAMTAHAMKGDRERCLAAGMDGYLSKPVNALEMIGLVESLACGAVPLVQTTAAGPGQADTPTQESSLVFNPDEAITRCFNSAKMVREMIQCFFDEVDSLLPQMRSALEKGDLVEVGRLGHRMKGTVVYLSAQPAKEAALRVERFCKCAGGALEEAEEAIDALEDECIALKAALAGHPLAADPAKDR